jgi:hypothetical protein
MSGRPTSRGPRAPERHTVLFVAREPDETLRTFLPIVERLRSEHGVESRVLFHHTPGDWARRELGDRTTSWREVAVPRSGLPGRVLRTRLGRSRVLRTGDEIGRLWQTKRLARTIVAEERPIAVVVIQDTLLLERFLVRQANQLGIPTLVVQWAFNYPQEMYDRLRVFQYGKDGRTGTRRPSRRRALTSIVTRRAYRATLTSLGLGFDLANSYGGGEARLFAVMGEAFKEQYLAQGVRDKRIVVTGHPLHDAAHARLRSLDDAERAAIRKRYALPATDPLVLYATQPVLWRRVMTPAELEENVRAVAAALARSGRGARLVLKLHPREQAESYAFCGTVDPPVRVIPQGEITDLIAAADAFISSSSSTVLLAMMLGRPIVTVNFNQVPHFDYFETVGGTLHARTHEEFEVAIDLALHDAPTRDRLAHERKDVLDRYTRFDGRASERLAGLIAEAIGAVPTRAAAR